MKRTQKRRKGEPLYEWIERIAPSEEMKELLVEVSKQSYITGSNAMHKTMVDIWNKSTKGQ